MWELGLLLRHWLPLVHPDDLLASEELLDPTQRTNALLSGYGIPFAEWPPILAAAIETFDRSVYRLGLKIGTPAYLRNRRAKRYAIRVFQKLLD